jgi:hypothetical protein
MDPALPLFSFDNPGGRLDKGDASYVDVIHTCGGWLGFERGLGHADFYPNGGSFTQPGCGSDVTGKMQFFNSHKILYACQIFGVYQSFSTLSLMVLENKIAHRKYFNWAVKHRH